MALKLKVVVVVVVVAEVVVAPWWTPFHPKKMVILAEMESLELIHHPLMIRIQKHVKRFYFDMEGEVEGEVVGEAVALALNFVVGLEYLTEKMSL